MSYQWDVAEHFYCCELKNIWHPSLLECCAFLLFVLCMLTRSLSDTQMILKVLHDYVYSLSFIIWANDDYVTNVWQLHSWQESDPGPFWPAYMLSSQLESQQKLACVPRNCTLCSIVHVEKRVEFCLGIWDQRDVKSDSRSAGGPLVCTALCLVLEQTSKREQQKSSSPHILHIWLLVGTVSDNGCWLFYLCF